MVTIMSRLKSVLACLLSIWLNKKFVAVNSYHSGVHQRGLVLIWHQAAWPESALFDPTAYLVVVVVTAGLNSQFLQMQKKIDVKFKKNQVFNIE